MAKILLALCLAGSAEAFLLPSLPIRHARNVARAANVNCQLRDSGNEYSSSSSPVDRRAALLGGSGLLLGAAFGGSSLPAVAADVENLNIKVPVGRTPNVVSEARQRQGGGVGGWCFLYDARQEEGEGEELLKMGPRR